MDIFLSKVTQQAMNYAIRSGLTITATYAIKQSTRFIQQIPKNQDHDKLQELQLRLHSKIRIISPAIDMIELIAARGNSSLESAVALTKELRSEIQAFGQRMASAVAAAEAGSTKSPQTQLRNDMQLKVIISDMKQLLARVEEAVPLINLAITTSGASLSSRLPPSVSPSRLLQASTLLNAGDMQYCISPNEAVQIGPSFTLTVYMLFSGHVRPTDEESVRNTTWKEVMHKARVKLRRVPLHLVHPHKPDSPSPSSPDESHALELPTIASADEYAYQMMIIEDLDDDRFHTTEENGPTSRSFDDVDQAGISETFPVFQLGKIFYADTGKVLNIGSEESNSPVLLLKRDLNAQPPRSWTPGAAQSEDKADDPAHKSAPTKARDQWSLPAGLDPEWIALEIFDEAEDSEEESDTEESLPNQPRPSSRVSSRSASLDPHMMATFSRLNINGKPPSPTEAPKPSHGLNTTLPPAWMSNVQTSLSLLEVLLRLVALSEYLQTSHLAANDQWLNFFLEESKATGAEGDESARQRVRQDARRRVGFDPYDESPVKRRGEEYQYQHASGQQWLDSPRAEQWSSPVDPRSPNGGAWSPPSGMQTRSITGFSPTPSTSPMPLQKPEKKDRKTWLQRRDDKTGSPLRPQTGNSDEGIGTSPGSGKELEPTEDS